MRLTLVVDNVDKIVSIDELEIGQTIKVQGWRTNRC